MKKVDGLGCKKKITDNILNKGINSKLFTMDLDKELQAAERFLNKNNDESLKNEYDDCYAKDSAINTQVNFKKTTTDINSFDQSLLKYQKQLKSYGFPEIGNFLFPDNSVDDKEKTFLFFDFILMKKSTENEEKMKYKKQIDLLSNKILTLERNNERLEKEIIVMNEELKKSDKEKKDFENKLNRSKEVLEKQINELKSLNTKLNNKFHILLTDKKAIEEKLNKITENYQKLLTKNNKAANNIDIIENLKKNGILKLLGKVKGTEKLIETFKNGYNESLRELLFEISGLKNFLYEINTDLIQSIKKESTLNDSTKLMELDYNLLNMPFLDTISKIKLVFRNNLKFISSRNFDMSFNIDNKLYNNYDNLYDDSDLTIEKKNDLKSEFKSIFDLEDADLDKSNKEKDKMKSHILSTQEDDYEKELEYLKNKWITTLMNIKKETNNDSNDY